MLELDDAGVRARLRFALREHLGLGAQRVADRDGGGNTDVLEAQISHGGAVGDIAAADPDTKPARAAAVDKPGDRYRMFLGEFFVAMEQLRVHRLRCDAQLVALGHGARPRWRIDATYTAFFLLFTGLTYHQ